MGAIIDIDTLHARNLKNEHFFIDTNVWIFLTFMSSEISDHEKNKARYYSEFIQKIKDASSKIYTSPICLTELIHVIERSFLKLYNENNKCEFTLKDFRNVKDEREKVIEKIENCWEEVNNYEPIILPFNIQNNYTDKIINELKSSKLDSYDVILLHTMRTHKIKNILTDDKDFQTIKDIDVYTLFRN